MYYESVFRALNRNRVKYVVAGGMAVVLHGVVRLTVDLDIIVSLIPANVARFASAMEELGYRPKVPVKAIEFADPKKRLSWIKDKGMKVFSFYNPKKVGELIDVFVNEPIPYKDLNKEKKIVSAGKIRIPIVSIKHLKKLKRIAGREQDLADIRSLENLEGLIK